MQTRNAIKLKNGQEIPPGAEITWNKGIPVLYDGTGNPRRISVMGAARALGIEIPDLEELEFWTMDGVCESVLGERVEPDGIDEHGSPSWLLAFGMI